MPSRASIAFSAACALLAGIGSFFLVEREGDPKSRLQQVQQNIDGASELLSHHTVRVRPKDSPKPSDPKRTGYILEKPDGTRLDVDAPKNATPRQLEIAADSMAANGRSDYVLIDSAWRDAEVWWKDLTWSNQRSAERMALARFPSKPESVSSYDWDRRSQHEEFATEEVSTFQIRRAGYVSAAAVAAFCVVLLLLLALGWLWRAFLARVRELSHAMRGKPPQ